MDPESIRQQLIVLYRELAELTLPKCHLCRAPMICCDPMYCKFAKERAAEWNVTLSEVELGQRPAQQKDLLFMGPTGCVVPPHLRPLCTAHVCEQHLESNQDSTFQQRFWELRDQINDLEYELLPESPQYELLPESPPEDRPNPVRGKCVSCSSTDVTPPYRKCRKCQTRDRQRKQDLIAANLCYTCGEVPPELGKKQCTECLRIKSLKNKAWRDRRRKPLAKCICGRIVTSSRSKFCKICQKANIKLAAKLRIAKLLREGLCAICGKKRKPGHPRFCETHAKDSSQRGQTRYQKHQEEAIKYQRTYRLDKKLKRFYVKPTKNPVDEQLRELERRAQTTKILLTLKLTFDG